MAHALTFTGVTRVVNWEEDWLMGTVQGGWERLLMNLLAAMSWLSRDTTESAETRSNSVRRARSGEKLTGRKADFSGQIPNVPHSCERRRLALGLASSSSLVIDVNGGV